MLGMGRTVAAGATRAFEYMRIEEQGGRLTFTARPSWQESATFPSISVTPSKIVFENAAHDFPQRVIYARQNDGSLPGARDAYILPLLEELFVKLQD